MSSGWLPAEDVLGVAFLIFLDSLLPHLHPGAKQPEGLDSNWQRSTMLMLAVTLHNIPEGMAVGLAFALAVQHNDSSAYAAAMALAVGMEHRISRYATISAVAAGGDWEKSFCLRDALRYRRANLWSAGGAGSRRNPAADALAAQLCSGCDDVCRSRGTDRRRIWANIPALVPSA